MNKNGSYLPLPQSLKPDDVPAQNAIVSGMYIPLTVQTSQSHLSSHP